MIFFGVSKFFLEKGGFFGLFIFSNIFLYSVKKKSAIMFAQIEKICYYDKDNTQISTSYI
jgi:hypothetical protein